MFHNQLSHANMMNKYFISAMFMCMTSQSVFSQDKAPLMDEGEYRYDDVMQLWLNTNNASCIGIDSVDTHGLAQFCYNTSDGSYHRVQEGKSHNELSFFTERYQKIGKSLYGYGSFNFNNGSTNDRAWSDVMRTYNSNPFISGSSVPGRYDNQGFALTAKVGTVDMNGLRLGMGIDYTVADLSRLRDPRSRNRLLDYKVIPSLSYTTGGNTFGLSGYYQRRKEKMPSLTTVQNNPNLYYYQMSGLDAITGTVGGYSGFAREYVNHAFCGELSYGYRSSHIRTVNAVSMTKETESILEQYKREPGQYISYKYGFSSQNRIVGDKIIHQLDLSASFEQAYADEYRPQLVITIDSVSGHSSYKYDNLMTYKKRYQMEMLDCKLLYQANFTNNSKIIRFAGAEVKLHDVNQKHLLPSSEFVYRTMTVNARYGQALFSNHLWINAEVGYLISLKASLSLSNPDTDYAREVLISDMNYYDADAFRGKLSILYQMPVTIKGNRNMWFIKAYGETIRAKHSLNGSMYGLSMGLFI